MQTRFSFSTNHLLTYRHYAVVRGQPARLDKKLQKMEKSAEKSQFVSKQEVNEFLRTVDEEKPTLLQYLQAFKFFGMMHEDVLFDFDFTTIHSLNS